jgi:hypothetical protein
MFSLLADVFDANDGSGGGSGSGVVGGVVDVDATGADLTHAQLQTHIGALKAHIRQVSTRVSVLFCDDSLCVLFTLCLFLCYICTFLGAPKAHIRHVSTRFSLRVI